MSTGLDEIISIRYPVIMEKHPDSIILSQIGSKALRDHFDISRQALHYWRTRGIPKQHRNSVAMLAERERANGCPKALSQQGNQS